MDDDARPTQVLVVGSLNADLVTRAPRLPGDGETVTGTSYARVAGGKGLNQAVAAARAGARTAMLGAVGADDHGHYLRAQAEQAGVRLGEVQVLDSETSGVALIMVGEDAANRIVVVPGANGRVDDTVVEQGFRPAGVVLAQLETPLAGVAAALRLARAAGGTTVLNPAPAQALPAALLADVDWLVPNEHEAALLLGAPALAADDGDDGDDDAADDAVRAAGLAAARALQALGPRGVVVTLGARGAVAVGPGGAELVLAPFPVTPVDTTAAGDTFCGTFAAGLARGLTVVEALRRACAAGALSTLVEGAVPSIPTGDAVDRLLAGS